MVPIPDRKELIIIPPANTTLNAALTMDDLLFDTSTPGNVVWQITELTEFRRVLPCFIEKAAARGQKIVYIHFSGKSASLVGGRYIDDHTVPSLIALRDSRSLFTRPYGTMDIMSSTSSIVCLSFRQPGPQI